MGKKPGYEAVSDESLIAAIRAGDADAFEVLYFRYRDWVVRLAFRFTRDQDAALDVLQETFAYLVRKIPALELRARLTTFLYPVVRHTALRWREKMGRVDLHPHETLEAIAAFAAIPPPPSPEVELHDFVGLLERLPPIHREVVLMRFVDDMSLDEIAAALDIPLGTVKSRLHHALQSLREDPRVRELLE